MAFDTAEFNRLTTMVKSSARQYSSAQTAEGQAVVDLNAKALALNAAQTALNQATAAERVTYLDMITKKSNYQMDLQNLQMFLQNKVSGN